MGTQAKGMKHYKKKNLTNGEHNEQFELPMRNQRINVYDLINKKKMKLKIVPWIFIYNYISNYNKL